MSKKEIAASGWASGGQAVHDAVAAALAGLDCDSACLVLIYPDRTQAPSTVLAQAKRAAPGVALAGMRSEGIITPDGVRQEGCGAFALSSDVRVGIGLGTWASGDLRAAGRDAAAGAVAQLELVPGHSVVLLLLDPTSGDESRVIDGVYEVVGGMIPLAGGGANGPAPTLFADGRACGDSVVAIAIVSPEPIALGLSHGCEARPVPAIVTRTEGRAILELDGRPAEEVYLEGLGRAGAELSDDEFERLAVLHPLAQPELRGELRLRHILRRAPAGGLACATPVPMNAAIWFCEQTEQSVIGSAGEAVRAARAGLPGAPRAGLVFDCAARKRAVGERLAEEAAAFVAAFGAEIPIGGLYTRGEVGRARGAKGDRAHAAVVVAFG